MPRDFAESGSDGGSAGTQIFSEKIFTCIRQKICRCGFLNVAIYPECDSTETLKESAAKGQSVLPSCNKNYCLGKFKQMEIERPFYVSVSPSVIISSQRCCSHRL